MSVRPVLQLGVGQHLTITPQLQQAIKLLQLSYVELQEEIQTKLENNPFLEQQEDTTEAIVKESHPFEGNSVWEKQIPLPSYSPIQSDKLENQYFLEASLKDYLTWQMELTPFTETDQLIAENIIDAINENGYLETKLSDVYENLKTSLSIQLRDIEIVLHRIQQFEPLGVGSRDLKECLLIQLNKLVKHPWAEVAKKCVNLYLELLAKKDYAHLKRKLKISGEDLRQVISLIQSLNPRPGNSIGHRISSYIVPDAIVYKFLKDWVVELNPNNIPKLRIHEEYAKLIHRANTSMENHYLRKQMQEARWFLKTLHNRNETLLKVIKCIVSRQKNFFEYGESAMKPMTLNDVAEEVQMHESTISRITTQKYLLTPRGVFELKFFFSPIISTHTGEQSSATAVSAFIKKIITSEDPSKPLSDRKIVQLLQQQGICVARRTVAKYRENMKIASSTERKQFV